MSDLRIKIVMRMDTLEAEMNENLHLSNPDAVLETMANITKFWTALSEEDRDYLHAARYALEEKLVWNDGK
jgi:hypothetical protein